MVVVMGLVGVSVRPPARLIAQEQNSCAHVSLLLNQADQAVAQQLWQRAVSCLEKTMPLLEEPQRADIAQRLQWCRIHADLEERYRDGSINRWVQATTVRQAGVLLVEVLQLLRQKYYQEVDFQQLFEKALVQLQAASENPIVNSHYRLDDADLKNLKRTVRFFSERTWVGPNMNGCDLNALLESLHSFSAKTGLGSSWAVMELAFALVNSLDEYSYMLSPPQYEELTRHLAGNYLGVGVDLVFDGSYPTIFDVVPDSPAQKAGLLPGDLLLKVNQENVREQSAALVGKLLAQPENQPMGLTISRNQQELSLFLSRVQLNAASVRYVHLLDAKNNIGYMRVASFDRDTFLEIRCALEKLKSCGVKSLLIDLRGNGGGMLRSAVDAAGIFLDGQVIVTVNSAVKKTVYRSESCYFPSFSPPIAILVDERTASAAEIFAAALKDNRRAVLIGQRTLGKDLVQTLYQLEHARAAVCITTASYLPPSNNNYHRKGIMPDITVEMFPADKDRTFSMAFYLSEEDLVLQRAIDYFRR